MINEHGPTASAAKRTPKIVSGIFEGNYTPMLFNMVDARKSEYLNKCKARI